MASTDPGAAQRQPRFGPIRDTPLTWSIRSIRRRLRKGQGGFSVLVFGHPLASQISRWESGQVTPTLKNLLALLNLAATPEECTPILAALRAEGIDDLVANLPAYLSQCPNVAASDGNPSIGREQAVINA